MKSFPLIVLSQQLLLLAVLLRLTEVLLQMMFQPLLLLLMLDTLANFSIVFITSATVKPDLESEPFLLILVFLTQNW